MRAPILAVIALLWTSASLAVTPEELQKFDAGISQDDLRDWLKQLASAPNQVGSPHDKANAAFELAKFKEWGFDAHIEIFDVLYPTPITETLELTGATPFKATLQEPAVPGDPSTANLSGALPAYVAFQGDGDVTAGLVYVNYGMPDDYKALARLGVDVRGKIAIARYGQGWRGLKPKLAQDHGAVGCLIYSDPADDGFATGDAYPAGPMRPAHGVQRGSVADMTIFPGDPLTPGVGATKDAVRLKREDAPTILKIPVLPISHADAEIFLASLKGPVVPEDWRGALPITYHVGPGADPVHLAVKSDWSLKPVFDVIATMPGSALPDQWIVRGNHHDAWVFGASDPLSGQIALMAEAKSIGALAKTGWRPKRTLVYTSWDAEEPMLVGSTEWVETHAEELKRKVLLYVNSDTNMRGFLLAGGSQDFEHLVNEAAESLIDPQTHVSVAARKRAKLQVDALAPDASPRAVAAGKQAAQKGADFPIEALGSGSDYSPFLQHLGVPAVDLLFAEEGEVGGVYHSAYDTFTHHSRFADPGFVYDALLAKMAGRVVLSAADSVLPVQRARGFAAHVASYLADIKQLVEKKRAEAETQAGLLRDRIFVLAADPTKQEAPPEALPHVPYIELAPLENAVDRLGRSASAYDDALARSGAMLSGEKLARLQNLMLDIDQTLAPEVGLPGRGWYKNLIYAPGRLTGYGAKTLPGVREAVEDGRWSDADHYAALTAAALNAYSDRLDQAAGVLGGTP